MKKKRELEKHIEKRFLKELKKRWSTAKNRKMNGYGHRSWHDRLIILPKGVIVLIEFKRPGEALSPGQENFHFELKNLGHDTFVCDDAMQAIEICEAKMINAEFVHAKRKKA